MIVSDLIKLLEDCNPDAELVDAWDNEIIGIDDDCDENEDPQTVMILS